MDLNHFKKLVDLNFHISSSGKLFSGTVHTASIAFQGVILKLLSTRCTCFAYLFLAEYACIKRMRSKTNSINGVYIMFQSTKMS